MILFASAGFSVRDAQAGEKRGGIAAHKYEGLTNYQRTIPRARRDRSNAVARPNYTADISAFGPENESNYEEDNAHFATGNERMK
jgi:hypothetical protein